MAGKLIVFEGANEVGKSTLAALLYTALRSRNIACDLVAFPGNVAGTLGRHVYELHHGASRFGVARIDATSLQLMHIAAHVDAIEHIIKPAIECDRVVILDRFWWSTQVYGTAGLANQHSVELMIEIERHHWGSIAPDVMFLVNRTMPVTPLYNMDDWRKIAQLYKDLAFCESSTYRVKLVENDGPIDLASRLVLEHFDALN
jgi:dTMP kinase